MPCWPRCCVVVLLFLGVGAARAAESNTDEQPRDSFAALQAALRADQMEAAAALAQRQAEEGSASAMFVAGFLMDVGAGAELDHTTALAWLRRAADQGHLNACRYLSWKYASGFGLEQPDQGEAGRWQERAAAAQAVDDLPDRWLEPTSEGVAPKLARAFFWMLDRASDGGVVAQWNLAQAYLGSSWTSSDVSQHLRWLRKAAEQGHRGALERLAVYYEHGLWVDADPVQALAFQRAAAEAGSADMQFALARRYARGDGVEQNHVESVRWYRAAAAQDHVEGLLRLADVLRAGAPGVEPDKLEALRLARRAAEQGSAEGMADVAAMLREGDGVTENPPAALALFEQAAEKNYAYAALMAGWMHRYGDLGEPDYVAARAWFERAAGLENARAMRELASLYEGGLGVAKDAEKAFEWIERAAREGEAWSQNRIGWMLRQGIGCEQDDEEAVTWFRLAAENGEPFGHANLGYHCLEGRGMPRDQVQALRHLIQAARESDDDWVVEQFLRAVFASAEGDWAEIRELLTATVDEELMSVSGALPELCLAGLEKGPPGVRNTEATARLLEQMIATRRPKALLVVAEHAYFGKGMPFDPERARAFATAAAAIDPARSALLLARIDSVAAADPAVRAAARAGLRRMAEEGDAVAAFLVAQRAATGAGEDHDLQLAEKYFALSRPRADDAAVAFAQFLRVVGTPHHDAPSPGQLMKAMADVEAERANLMDAPPAAVHRRPPVFPAELRLAEITGEARVEFVVDESGLPVDVRATESTHPLFAAAAENCIANWRFAAARKDGKPVRTRLVQPIQFHLGG